LRIVLVLGFEGKKPEYDDENEYNKKEWEA
jgi:hypothetical protein